MRKHQAAGQAIFIGASKATNQPANSIKNGPNRPPVDWDRKVYATQDVWGSGNGISLFVSA
jgi:hypothetical protein